MPDAVNRPTGAKPSPRHKLAGAIPHRIVSATPPQFIVVPPKLSYWLNNTDGDCVTAEEAFAKAAASVMAGQSELFVPDDVVQSWAAKHGVLNGAVISDVLDWMTQSGFMVNGTLWNDGLHSSVDWTNISVLQSAIAQGPVKIGVASSQLQQVVRGSNGWFATRFRQDQDIDHCVSLCGYGPMSYLAQSLGVSVPANVTSTALGYALFTWDTIGIIDVPSLLAITAEAWLRTPTNVIVGPTPPQPVPPVPPVPPVVPPPPPLVPPPAPGPSPSIRQQFDAVMAQLEALAGSNRQALRELKSIQQLIDGWLSRQGLGDSDQLEGVDAVNWQHWLTLVKAMLASPILRNVAIAMIQAVLTQSGLPPAVIADLQALLQQALGERHDAAGHAFQPTVGFGGH